MKINIKHIIFSLALCFLLGSLSAQPYKIRDVEYDITGATREYPLSKAVEIDITQIFSKIEDLEDYIDDLVVQFQSQRVLESVEIFHIIGDTQQEGTFPVDLLIKTVDSFNFIAAPYPKYDSNDGFEFKIDSKNYNFLGSMQTLDAEVYYEYELKDEDNPYDKDTHSFGGMISFAYPFAIGVFDANWTNSASLSYTIGNDTPNASLSTGLGLGYTVNDVLAFSLSFTQGIIYDRDYLQFDDALYFSESAALAMPITLARTDNLGTLAWTPSISTTYYWDMDGINTINEDLFDTDVIFAHGLSLGRTDWIGNFKDGFSLSLNQSLTQPLLEKNFSISESLELKYFKAFTHLGIKSRAYLFSMQNSTAELGGRIRGIPNSNIDTDSLFAFNFDLPIKVWQTDWVGYGLWDWTKYLDFEMQISPFFDFAIGYNPHSGSYYSIKDGWYAAGIEITGYLNAARSVVGRISGGVDVVQFAEKVGNRIDFVGSAVDTLFNTGWRADTWYEFSFGIGLFY